MKAVVYEKYGTPEVLQITEVEKPIPKEDEVLVKVKASSINAADSHLLSGTPFIMRLMGFGLLKPKHKTLGVDVAGVVEAVGENVKDYKAGDEVIGDCFDSGLGSFAEYVSVKEEFLTLKPSNITFELAAATPLASCTALLGLRDIGKIKEGQKVLINGAGGGVGSFAVQIAKTFGANVTGVCSTGKVEMVRSIGADSVIDYKKNDFTKEGELYDIILDTAAFRPVKDYMNSLNDNGKYVVIGGDTSKFFKAMLFGSFFTKGTNKKILSVSHKANKELLDYMKNLLEAGKVVPQIDKTYPLKETKEAFQYFLEKHPNGKIVITMEG